MYGAITHYGHTFQSIPLTLNRLKGCSHFARRYFGNLGWFLFLQVLRCFSSPRLLPYPMYSGKDTAKGSGFPHSEIFGSKFVCQLPEAYRKLLRPSSPVVAKAFTMCAYSLDHITPNVLNEPYPKTSFVDCSEPQSNKQSRQVLVLLLLTSRSRSITSTWDYMFWVTLFDFLLLESN